MAGLGIGIAFVGYWTLYYGITQIQGGNWGFLDLGIPGRWAAAKDNPRDNGSTPAAATTPAASTTAESSQGPTPLGGARTNANTGTVSVPGLPVKGI